MEDPFQTIQPQTPSPSGKAFLSRTAKLSLIGGGIFLFFLILTISSYWLLYQQDRLIKFAPVDTVLYFHAKPPLWPQNNFVISDLPFVNFYQQVDHVFSWPAGTFKNEILGKSAEVSFLLLPNQEQNNLDWVFVIKPLADSVIQTVSKLPYQMQLAKDVITFGSSSSAIAKVKEVTQDTIFSLALKVKDSSYPGLVGGYLNGVALADYISGQTLVSRIFNTLFDSDIYFSLAKVKDHWQFNITGQSVSSPVGRVSLLTQNLPADFIFFTNSINLSNLFLAWIEVDPELGVALNQIGLVSQSLYDFDFSHEIKDLFAQSGNLLIMPSVGQSVFGADFIFIFEKVNNSVLTDLEKLISIALAQKQPLEFIKTLPDSTVVTELRADPSAYTWSTQALNDSLSARYLSVADLNFTIGYLETGDKTFIFSSLSSISNYLADSVLSMTDLIMTCGNVGQEPLSILNSQTANSANSIFYYLPVGQLVFSSGLTGEVSGCFVDF